jgi:hypothetical protein
MEARQRIYLRQNEVRQLLISQNYFKMMKHIEELLKHKQREKNESREKSRKK